MSFFSGVVFNTVRTVMVISWGLFWVETKGEIIVASRWCGICSIAVEHSPGHLGQSSSTPRVFVVGRAWGTHARAATTLRAKPSRHP